MFNYHIPLKVWLPVLIVLVAAVGYLTWTESLREQKLPPSAPSLTKEGVGGVPGDWQTYRNEEYGFEVRYPSEWTAKELTLNLPSNAKPEGYLKSVNLSNNSGALVGLTIYSNSKHLSLDKWIDENMGAIITRKLGPVVVNGITGLKYMTSEMSESLNVSVVDSNVVVNFYIDPGSKYQNTFDQILSTFKFIAPVIDTSNWKIYKDSNNGFEFKYPSNFSVQSGDHPDYPQGSFLKAHGGVNASAPISAIAIFAQSSYPGRNLVGAWLAVASDPVIANTADCQDFEKNGYVQKLPQTQTLNGVTWYKGVTGGAAAGTGFENRVHHVLHNEICYEVDLNLATTGTGSAANMSDVWGKLDSIFSTFKFTK